jgi:hypothetical protein
MLVILLFVRVTFDTTIENPLPAGEKVTTGAAVNSTGKVTAGSIVAVYNEPTCVVAVAPV